MTQDLEFVIHKQEDRVLDLEFIGQRRTIPQLLKERLLDDDKVETSTVLQDHPVLDEPRVVIRTAKGRRPETALKNAAKSLRQDFDTFEDDLLDAL